MKIKSNKNNVTCCGMLIANGVKEYGKDFFAKAIEKKLSEKDIIARIIATDGLEIIEDAPKPEVKKEAPKATVKPIAKATEKKK